MLFSLGAAPERGGKQCGVVCTVSNDSTIPHLFLKHAFHKVSHLCVVVVRRLPSYEARGAGPQTLCSHCAVIKRNRLIFLLACWVMCSTTHLVVQKL